MMFCIRKLSAAHYRKKKNLWSIISILRSYYLEAIPSRSSDRHRTDSVILLLIWMNGLKLWEWMSCFTLKFFILFFSFQAEKERVNFLKRDWVKFSFFSYLFPLITFFLKKRLFFKKILVQLHMALRKNMLRYIFALKSLDYSRSYIF